MRFFVPIMAVLALTGCPDDAIDSPPVTNDMAVDSAQDTSGDPEDLGTDTANPVADMAASDDVAPDVDIAEPAYDCPMLPIDCATAQPNTTEHFLVPAEPCGFSLQAPSEEEVTTQRALIAALAAQSNGVVPMSAVLGDLNRVGTAGITANNAERLQNHDWRGFRWNSGDMSVDYWYPQGITGTSDAYDDGLLAGREALLVSWYHNSEDRPTKGVRISLADITDLANVTYRHLLLVEPTGTVDAPSFRAAQTGSGGALHAGGIVWWGDWLYVADTTGGFRVYDLANIMRVKNTDDADRIGVDGERFDGLGYAYVVPELLRYRRDSDGCDLRFSFVGLDRSSEPPVLVSGEYRVDDIGGRLVTWNLDAATGELDVRRGEVRASAAFVSGQTRMQGGLRYEGNLYMSSSSQVGSFGRLYRTREGFGESSITAWVYGAEDLYMQRDADVIWTPAEHPDNRDVVGIPLVRP